MIVFWCNDEPMALKEIFSAQAHLRGCELRNAATKAWAPNKDKAMKFVTNPNRALGGKSPLEEAVSSYEGLERALNVIGRIEHGVYS